MALVLLMGTIRAMHSFMVFMILKDGSELVYDASHDEELRVSGCIWLQHQLDDG